MKIMIQNTSQIVEVNGVPARVWDGVTDRGGRVQVLVTRVAVRYADDDDASSAS
jgi:hypothetical protein